MRRPACLLAAAVAVTVVSTLCTPSTGSAAAGPPHGQQSEARSKALSCPIVVTGVTADQHLVLRTMNKDTVIGEKQSGSTLPVDPAALGFYSWHDTDGVVRLRMTVTAADGIPRLLKATDRPTSSTLGVTLRSMQQTGFRPRLFADAFDYRVYTVSRAGALQRWFLTKEPNGDLHFTDRLKLGTGFDSLTALQVASRVKGDGVWRDILMATTDTGRLKEIVVPLKRPKRMRTYTLATSGFSGVTGISTSFCQNNMTYSSLVMVDAVANTATWATVKHIDRPRDAVTTLRGPAGVGADWVLHAVW